MQDNRFNHYWRFTPWQPLAARLWLIGLAALIIYGILLEIRTPGELTTGELMPPSAPLGSDRGDVALYRAIVTRMQAGEAYYAAVAAEQVARGYPTRPFLTWRLPTTAWLISTLGETPATMLLRLLALAAILAWIRALGDAGLTKLPRMLGALMVFFSLAVTITPPSLYFHEAWAGTLIALALPLYSRWWRLSLILSLAALAFRELALPFVLVMAAVAYLEGRRVEATWWTVGIFVFLMGLALHAWQVQGLLGLDAKAGTGWLALGGWHFVLSTLNWNLIGMATPAWFAAIWVPLAWLGAAARQDSLGTRLFLTVSVYIVIFLFVGREDNHYWGILISPLVTVSLVYTPMALQALWHSALGHAT